LSASLPPAVDGERAAKLRALGVLDPDLAWPALDGLVRRACAVGGFPVGWISFLDDRRERLAARTGVTFAQLGRESSLAFALGIPRSPVFVDDLAAGSLRGHALAAEEPLARFASIVPLVAADGFVVGTLTVLDRTARSLDARQRSALANLAALAMARIESHREASARVAAPTAQGSWDADPVAALRRERDFSSAVLDSLVGVFFLLDREGAFVRWNASLAAVTGYADAEIASMRPLDFVSPRDRDDVASAIRAVLDEGREVKIEAEIVDRVGNVRPYALSAKPLAIGDESYLIGVAQDITLRRRAEQQIVRAKERLDLALTGSRLALWDWDIKADKVFFNEGWFALLGEVPRESTFAGPEVLGWTHPDDRAVLAAALGNAAKSVSEEIDCEYRVAKASGEWLWVHTRGKVTQRDGAGKALRMTGTSTDVTKRKAAEERAEYLATRDALTGLPNRVLLHDRLEQGVSNAARGHAGFAFMFIDLDRFKTINDSLGHQVGDELLKEVARRLDSCVRTSDTVARLGGDEFAVILENLRGDDAEGAQHVAEKMIAAMAAPILVGSQSLTTSCSIGIGLYPADGRDSETLMKSADVAMYYAKEKGRNNYQFFSAEMNSRAHERLSVENYLRLALNRNELVVHYQPRIRIADGELVGVEALVRWQHPRRGLLLPGKFIDVAEESGLIVPMGEWVLERACAQVRAWQQGLRAGLRLSVNLAVRQLGDGERLVEAVAGALESSGLDPETLELELTESHLMRDIEEKARLLNRLGDLGVGLAIDDFGTGYSSLSYLKSLPVDSIKIDGSFIRGVATDPDDEAIVRAILAMAHSLRLSVVAECVENAEQLERLRALGCDEYQGFLESAALAPPQFEERYGKEA
jgi:diguanylate cyclase (GGDEF)-like protein/PAS domain S-box-containing protein